MATLPTITEPHFSNILPAASIFAILLWIKLCYFFHHCKRHMYKFITFNTAEKLYQMLNAGLRKHDFVYYWALWAFLDAPKPQNYILHSELLNYIGSHIWIWFAWVIGNASSALPQREWFLNSVRREIFSAVDRVGWVSIRHPCRRVTYRQVSVVRIKSDWMTQNY